MPNIKNLIYVLTGISFTIIIGAGIYEHLAIWPRAYSAPPASLTMFQGDYGLNSDAFWTKIHPITLLLLITTLVLSWKSPRKKYVLITLIGYIFILVVTAIYFVPELMEITKTEYADSVNPDLQQRGGLWENLNLLRALILVFLAMILNLGLTRSSARAT